MHLKLYINSERLVQAGSQCMFTCREYDIGMTLQDEGCFKTRDVLYPPSTSSP